MNTRHSPRRGFASRLCLSLLCALSGAPAALGADNAVPVAVTHPKETTVTDELRLTGTLTAERDARLSPRVDGLVSRLRVDAGDRVKAGDALLELDAALAEHALKRAEAESSRARAAQAEAQRLMTEAQRLVAQKHLPQTELARRESDLKLAESVLAASLAAEREQQELVRRHVLPAPFAGVIARRLTDVGEWVTRGTPVLELVATDNVRLDLQVPQEYFALIDMQARVQVEADAVSGAALPGRIAAQVPVSDSTARTFLVRIVLSDSAARLLPGTSATARIQLTGDEDAVVIPRDALLRYPDGTYSVFVVHTTEGRSIAQERRVTVGRGGQEVEILEGLSARDRVVIRGNETLRDGQAVAIRGGS